MKRTLLFLSILFVISSINLKLYAQNAGADSSICHAYINLYAEPAEGVWSTIGNAVIYEPSNANSYVAQLAQGTNVFTWTLLAGGSDEVIIYNNSISAVASDTEACSSTIPILGSDPVIFGGTGYWTITGGSGTILDQTSYNTQITGVPNGSTSTLSWTVDNGTCQDSKVITVTNNNFTVSAGPNETICGSTWQANAEDPGTGTGQWTVETGLGIIDNNTLNTATFSNIAQGANTFRWTVTRNGCTSSDDVIITNNEASEAVITGPMDTETCAISVGLEAQYPQYGTGEWAVVSGSGTFIDYQPSVTLTYVTVTNLSPGENIFSWTVMNEMCSKTQNITITHNSLIVADAGTDQTINVPSTTLNGNDPLAGEYGLWSHVGSNTSLIHDPTNNITQISNLQAGENSFEWRISDGLCESADTIIVTVLPNAGEDQTVCESFTNLQALVPLEGVWSTASSAIIQNTTSYNTEVSNLQLGTNVFTWTSAYGSDDVAITYSPLLADAGTDQDLCADMTQLDAQIPAEGAGVWSIVSGNGVITDTTDPASTVTALMPGQNIFKWTVSNGTCTVFDEVNINNNTPSPAVISASTSTETCSGIVYLFAELPDPMYGTGYWETVSGSGTIASSTDVFTVYMTGLAPGNNTFRWTIENSVCSSFDEITITNNAVIANAGADAVICSDSYQLNAENPAQGTGSWTNISGITAVIENSLLNTSFVYNITESSTFRWTVQNGSCSAFDEILITPATPVSVTANAGPDQTVTDNFATLAANSPGSGETGFWAVADQNPTSITTPTSTITEVGNLQAGSNAFEWVIQNMNCESRDTVIVTFDMPIANAGADQEVCENTATLTAAELVNGVWSTSGSAVITSPTSFSTTVLNLEPGENIFTWAGQYDSDQVIITNNSPSEAVIIAPQNTESCDGTFNLEAQTPIFGTGLWTSTGGGLIENPTNAVTFVSGLAIGENTFSWTVTNEACESTAGLTVTNTELTVFAGNDQTLCENTALLSADPPAEGQNGLWTVTAGNATIINPTAYNTEVPDLSQGENILTWTLSQGQCSGSDGVIITNNTPSEAFIVVPGITESCDGTFNLEAETASIGTGLWTSTGGGIIETAANPTTFVSNLDVGENTFVWTVSNGACESTAELTITNTELTAFAGNDQTLCENTALLSADPPAEGQNGLWTVTAGNATIINPTAYNTEVPDLSQGENILTWTLSQGQCSGSDGVIITNNTPSEAFIVVPGITESCDGTFNLEAETASIGTGLWTSTGGGLIENPTNAVTFVSGLAIGENTFSWTVTNEACESTAGLTVTNTELTVFAGNDQTLCENTALLSADPPAEGQNGLWTVTAGNATIINPTAYNTEVPDLSQGENILTWTLSQGQCSGSDGVIITNNTPSEAFIVVPEITESCDGTFNLEAETASIGTGLWTSTGGGLIENPTNAVTFVSGLAIGENTFSWTVTNEACESTAGLTVTNTELTVFAGNDQTLCENTALLSADPPAEGQNGLWTVTAGNATIINPTAYNTEVTDLSQGENILTWTLSQGQCSGSDGVIITNNTPSEAFIVVPGITESCDGTFNLEAESPTFGTGLWTSTGGGLIENPTNAVTFVSGLAIGENTFSWTVTNEACESTAGLTVTNTELTVFAGNDQTLCENTALLSADPPAEGQNGLWTVTAGNATITNPTLYNTEVPDLSQGENILTWTLSQGQCSGSDGVIITNNTPSEAFIVVPGITESCDGTFNLEAESPTFGTGLWTSTGGGLIENPTNAVTFVSGLAIGENTFSWTVTNEACESTAGLTVTNTELTVFAGNDQTLCENTALLSADPPAEGQNGLWTVTAGNATITNPTLYNTEVPDLSPGENIFAWTLSQGQCSSSDEVFITNNSPSEAAILTANNSVSCNGNITLEAETPNIGAGIWSTTGNAIISSPESPLTEVSNLVLGDNSFIWTLTNADCESSAQVNIIYQELLDVYAGEDTTFWSYVEPSPTTGIQLNADAPPAGAFGTWTTNNPNVVIENPSLHNTFVGNMHPGMHQFNWTINNGTCEVSDQIRVMARIVITNKPNSKGDWNSAQTWQPELVPTTFDSVRIANGSVMLLDSSGQYFEMYVGSGGDLQLTGNNSQADLTGGNMLIEGFETETPGTLSVNSGGNLIVEQADSTVQKGNADIKVRGGGLFIEQTAVKNTKAGGGNVRIRGGGLFIEQSAVKTAKAKGGEVRIRGGGLFIEQSAVKATSGNITVRGGGLFIEQSAVKADKATGGIVQIQGGGLFIEQSAVKADNPSSVRVGTGGGLFIEQSAVKAESGQVVVRGGGLFIEQTAVKNKAVGDAEVRLRGGNLYIEQSAVKADKATAGNVTVRSGGGLFIEQSAVKNAKAPSGDIIIRGGELIVEESGAKSSKLKGGKVQIRGGGIFIEQTAVKSYSGSVRIKGGGLFIEQSAVKSRNKLSMRGGGLFIEQTAVKADTASVLHVPQIIAENSLIRIGNPLSTTAQICELKTGNILFTQDAELLSGQENFTVGSGSKLNFTDEYGMQAESYIQLGENVSATFTDDAELNVPEGSETVLITVEDGGSMIVDDNVTVNGNISIQNAFSQNPELFSIPLVSEQNPDMSHFAINEWSESAAEWNSLANPYTFEHLRGYFAQASLDDTVIFKGEPLGGYQSAEIYGSGSDINTSGWNLLGNPYTSAIDWEVLTIDGFENALYKFNPQTQNYGVYRQGGLSINNANQLIKVSEGFFVKANKESALFQLGKGKVHNIKGLLKLQTPADKARKGRLMMTLSDDVYSDQSLLVLEDGASTEFESQKDAFKFFADIPQLYTLAETGENLAINLFDIAGEEVKTIPLNIRSNSGGAFKLTADLQIADESVGVYLHDLATDELINLRENPLYKFSFTGGDDPERFELIFDKTTTGIPDDYLLSKVFIYSNDNSFYIKTPEAGQYIVEIYSALGSKLLSRQFNGKQLLTIKNTHPEGVYIVKVISGKAAYTKKVFVF